MDLVKSRQFHVLHMHPEHHAIVEANHSAIKSSLAALSTNLQETEIQFHGRSMVPDMNANFIDVKETNINKLSPVLNRKEKNRKNAERDLKKRNYTSERYYKLREKETYEDKSYLKKITVSGKDAAISHIDDLRVFSRMFRDATALQKAAFKQVPKVEKKSGGRSEPFWAGSNPPHLAPGTYNDKTNTISHNVEIDDGIALPSKASFNDTRNSDRDSFLGRLDAEVVDVWEDEVQNAFSRRSAKSSTGLKGVLSRHKNPKDFKIAGGRKSGGGLRPEDFLERMKEKERKAKPFDFSFGALAPEYSRDPNELVDDPVSPAAKDSSVPGTTPAALSSIGDLTDCSAEATNDFYRRWRKANGIRINHKSDGKLRAKRPATGKKK
ncbi:hypothetical protein TrVE_jg13959 [Triparma verrucosa]|uniref:Uncharacterized protein n=1 Tax=Triparma verrucosa TaxID=1606542 RepID=A0A9W7FM03_9STRA|nr:hypothetical protein TrVE_jg13959 [Triparma verrucosa]